ncbi:hypothetical protein OG455_36025 [Kitasatospora sp. NBC_01287]|uniref:hypothetical protein n=1 Tax=Kitasatospora sp. NBC_01287 TaxID=2903573 RepID=UPI00225C1444|nr:hypothetical protein [Kitasatospora sp. NBC_01287]MCX4750852.1 hypothetical protein [Kitasatospora sp. NBC_01287]
MSHHKSNKAVEGEEATGHGRGMPRRPDGDQLEERTEQDREEAGLDPDPGVSFADQNPEANYADERNELDREVAEGDVPTDRGTTRKERDPLPPTRYDG